MNRPTHEHRFRYASGELVRVGDRVRLKRWLRKPLTGVVGFVHDPAKPSPPKGDNEFGFSVDWDGPRPRSSWFGEMLPGLEFVASRGDDGGL